MTLFAAPAFAHNVLISSDPADGAVLDTAPSTVSFTFDQAIENFDPVLKVFGPDGNDFAAGAPTIEDTVISAPFDAGPAGDYRAVYRIVSADGHPVTGEITFTLSDAAAGDATGTAPSSGATVADTGSEAAADAEDGSTTTAIWIWTGVGFAVVLVIGAIIIAVRKPKYPPEGPQPPSTPESGGPGTPDDPTDPADHNGTSDDQ